MKQLLATRIDERSTPADLDQALRNVREVAAELQKQPFAFAKVAKADVVLVDGVATPVPHGLGRKAFTWHSAPRGAVTSGRIEEVRDGSYDATKYVVYKATGYGGPITVDVFVL